MAHYAVNKGCGGEGVLLPGAWFLLPHCEPRVLPATSLSCSGQCWPGTPYSIAASIVVAVMQSVTPNISDTLPGNVPPPSHYQQV